MQALARASSHREKQLRAGSRGHGARRAQREGMNMRIRHSHSSLADQYLALGHTEGVRSVTVRLPRITTLGVAPQPTRSALDVNADVVVEGTDVAQPAVERDVFLLGAEDPVVLPGPKTAVFGG